jgi:hypothetical protein
MKKFGRRPGRDETPSTRTGPRARAAQERRFSDPFQHAERPPRQGGFDRPERGDRGGLERPRSAVITLDTDVARVFRDSEAVNEALRLVMRLARLAGGRPPFRGDRPGGVGGPPRGREFGERRGPPRGGESAERRGPPRPRGPRFKEE